METHTRYIKDASTQHLHKRACTPWPCQPKLQKTFAANVPAMGWVAQRPNHWIGRSARGGVVMPGIPTSRHILEDQVRSASMTTSLTQTKTLRQASAGCPEVTTNSGHFQFKAWRGAEYGASATSRATMDAQHFGLQCSPAGAVLSKRISPTRQRKGRCTFGFVAVPCALTQLPCRWQCGLLEAGSA